MFNLNQHLEIHSKAKTVEYCDRFIKDFEATNEIQKEEKEYASNEEQLTDYEDCDNMSKFEAVKGGEYFFLMKMKLWKIATP